MTQNAINIGVVAGGGNTFTFPAATDTLVGRTSTDTLTNKTLTTPVINGTITGTGQATAATASTITMRDSNANIFVNNIVQPVTSTATSNGTLTLTVSSTRIQRFTGSLGHTVVLPVASTLTVGHTFTIQNSSTLTITVQSSGTNVIRTVGKGQTVDFVCILASGTDENSWFTNKLLVVLENSTTTNTALITLGNQGNPGTGTLGVTGTNGIDFILSNTGSSGSIILNTNSTNRLTILSTGQAGFGQSTPTAIVHLKAGTTSASSAPLKFTSGSLMSSAEAGAVEFLTDAFYGTITTGAARKTFAFLESPTFTGTVTLPTTTAGGVITLSENAAIALDPAGSADGKYTGITVAGTAGYTQAFGDLVYLDPTDSRWEAVDANSAAAADGDARGILGIVVVAGTDGAACTILLHGIVRADAKFPTFTINNPIYASETAGSVTQTQPTTTDVVIRVVGFALTADEMFLNPSSDYTTHT